MQFTTLLTVLFASTAMAGLNDKSCRQCDCTLKWTKSAPRPRVDAFSLAQVDTKAKRWLNLMVSGQQYDGFSLQTQAGASCPADTSQPCDAYEASFKAWRLCSNGGSFNCGRSDNGGDYSLQCNCNQSVKCRGACQEGCPALP